MNSYDFNVTQRSNFTVSINAQNSDGSYINLSGYNATGIVKYQFSSSGNLYVLNTTVDPSYTGGLIYVSGNITGGVPAGKYPYNIAIYNNNVSLNILNGYFNVYPETYPRLV